MENHRTGHSRCGRKPQEGPRAFGIARNGILVEISNNENRAIYAGISGAGSILPTIFPLIAGILISACGYNITFIIVSLIIVTSFVFIKKLNCRQ